MQTSVARVGVPRSLFPPLVSYRERLVRVHPRLVEPRVPRHESHGRGETPPGTPVRFSSGIPPPRPPRGVQPRDQTHRRARPACGQHRSGALHGWRTSNAVPVFCSNRAMGWLIAGCVSPSAWGVGRRPTNGTTTGWFPWLRACRLANDHVRRFPGGVAKPDLGIRHEIWRDRVVRKPSPLESLRGAAERARADAAREQARDEVNATPVWVLAGRPDLSRRR